MPIHEYICTKCKTEFELLRPFSEADKPAVCPKCNSEVQKLLSGFASKTGFYMKTPTKPLRGYPMAKGAIRRLITDRGFGFIQRAEGADLFFHRNELQGADYDSLKEGEEVEFEVGQDKKGRHQAIKVRLAQPRGEQHQAQLGGFVKDRVSE